MNQQDLFNMAFDIASKRCSIKNCNNKATWDDYCDIHLVQINDAYDEWLEHKAQNCKHPQVSYIHDKNGMTAYCFNCESYVTEELIHQGTLGDLEWKYDLDVEAEVERRVLGE